MASIVLAEKGVSSFMTRFSADSGQRRCSRRAIGRIKFSAASILIDVFRQHSVGNGCLLGCLTNS